MTIGIAIKGKDHVVLASDTCRTTDLGDGTYQDEVHKLFPFNGTWAMGVAGALEVIQVVKNFGADQIPGLPTTSLFLKVQEIRDRCFTEYKNLGGTETVWFLLAGVDDQEPFIYRWGFIKIDGQLTVYGPQEQGRFSAIGASQHGALYFNNEFCKEFRSPEQNVLWAFHAIAEVSKHDACVKRPIDFMVLRNATPPKHYSDTELPEFNQRSKEITQAIHSGLMAEGLRLK